MNNKQLNYAIKLSKLLSFSQVAEEFGISQPALSKQIINLEKELGIELFNRKQNPISLTPAGEHFFRVAEDLVFREEQLYKSMADFRSEKKGSLTIGVSPFRALYMMPSLCNKVREKFPGIKIVLQEYSSGILRNDAADGKYDFAIVNLPVEDSVFDVLHIAKDTLVLVVPKTLLGFIKKPLPNEMEQISFKDCSELPFVVLSQNQEMRHNFEKICSLADINPNIVMEVVGLATAWSMAQEGIGATLLPLQFVQSVNFDDKIKLFIPKCDTNVRQPAIIKRRGQYLSPYAKYAIDLLTKKDK